MDFLAMPLILLSAAFCILSLTPLDRPDIGLLPAAVFAVACRDKRRYYAALAALGVFLLYAVTDAVTPALADFCGAHPVLFGAVQPLYALCFGNRLSDLVLHTDCTGAVVTAKGIITGAADLAAAGVPSAPLLASRWLDGAYFVSVFLPPGGAAFLWQSAKKKERALLAAVTALSVLTGDSRLFALALVLCYPAGLVLYLLLSGLSYLTAALLQGGFGLTESPSAGALMKNSNAQTMLFVLAGVVLAVLFYFALRYTREKWRKHDEPA